MLTLVHVADIHENTAAVATAAAASEEAEEEKKKYISPMSSVNAIMHIRRHQANIRTKKGVHSNI